MRAEAAARVTAAPARVKAAPERRSIKAVDMGSGKVRRWRPDAHAAGVNALLPLAPDQVASGDDDGCVKLWDPRQPRETAELRQHTDYVSDFAHQARIPAAEAGDRGCCLQTMVPSVSRRDKPQ